MGTRHGHEGEPLAHPARNEVVLWGRLAAPPEERTLPSGDAIVTFRMVVPRQEGQGETRRRGTAARTTRPGQVDTIDVVCWSAVTRKAALTCQPGAHLEVQGALRRRFFAAPGGRQSRYEVEAAVLRRRRGNAPPAH